jgi:hypothetical protein
MAIVVAGLLILAPVWAPAGPVTTDGPSHTYNAAVSVALLRGDPLYGQNFSYDGSIAPNRAAGTLLRWIGPQVGWISAERIILSSAIGATFLLLLLRIRRQRATMFPAAILGAAWLAQSWFVWMGFFDFSLSVVVFLALVLTLEEPDSAASAALLQVLALLLAFTHVLALAVGVTLMAGVVVMRVIRRESDRRALLIPILPLALVLFVLSGGPAGQGDILWGDKIKAIAGLLIGDFVVTFSEIDLVAGATIMAGFWLTAGRLLRQPVLRLPTVSLFGLALIVGSVIVPDHVGEGSYIAARLRYLGVICLVPEIVRTLELAGTWVRRSVTAVLATALVGHAVLAIAKSGAVGRDEALIGQLLTEAGVGVGDAVQTGLTDHERGLFRLSPYAHLLDRVATGRRLLVVDNYEIGLSVFPVDWRTPLERIDVTPTDGGLRLGVQPGARLGRPIYILHEAEAGLELTNPSLSVARTIRTGPFAVTAVNIGPTEQRSSSEAVR